MRRRDFLGCPALLLVEGRYACAQQPQTTPKGPELKEELSASEIEVVNKSAMAKDLDNFFGKGFS